MKPKSNRSKAKTAKVGRADAPAAQATRSRPSPNVGTVCMPGSSTLSVLTGQFTNGQVLASKVLHPSTIETLAAQADVFQQYRFKSIRALITTDAASTNTGMLVAGFIRDPADEVPSGEAAIQIVDAQPGSQRFKIWQSGSVRTASTRWLYTSDSTDTRLSSELQFVLVHRGKSNAECTVEVKLEYVVEFKQRTLVPAVEEEIEMQPVIKPGLVLAFKEGKNYVVAHPEGTDYTATGIETAPAMFDYPFPDIPAGTPADTLGFRWRLPFAATYCSASGVFHCVRDLWITNDGSTQVWSVFPVEAGAKFEKLPISTQNSAFAIHGDQVRPVVAEEGNFSAVVSKARLSRSRPISGLLSRGWRPTLENVLNDSSLLSSYCKSGLVMSKNV